jgi:hypothetical protein
MPGRSDPVNRRDIVGLYTGVDDGVFIGAGALAGIAGQAFSDVLSGHVSTFGHYAAAGLGGAATGEALLYFHPVVAGAIGGAVQTV